MSSLLGGGNAGKSEMKRANQLMADNIAKLEAIGIPTVEAQQIALTNPEMVDSLVAEQMGPSAMESLQEDPRLRMSALQALSGVEELAQQGLGAEDEAAFRDLSRRAAGQAQAQIASQEQRMAEQGMSDSGVSAMLRQAAGQQAADRMSQEGVNIAAQAAAARRQALGQQSDMASRMSQQQLALGSQKASAADAIKQFNTQARQQTNMSNMDYQRQLANQRAATANQQEIYNKGLIQQKFQNEMAKTGGVVGAQGQQAANLQAQGAAAQQAQQAQTGALIGMAGTIGGAMVGGPAGAAVGSQLAQSGKGQITADKGSYDDYYMNKVR